MLSAGLSALLACVEVVHAYRDARDRLHGALRTKIASHPAYSGRETPCDRLLILIFRTYTEVAVSVTHARPFHCIFEDFDDSEQRPRVILPKRIRCWHSYFYTI